jgi:acetyltransferase-like isoleucine patch superfamily enzyme
MGMIFFRGKEMSIDNENPVDLHIPEFGIIIKGTILRKGVTLWANVNMYGADIGENCKIGSYVEIRKGVTLGKNTKLEPFVFIPEGVTLGEGVFIGPNVTFTNDVYPRSCHDNGDLITDYTITPTVVENYASIGAGCVIKCGITIGSGSLIGAGSVLVNNVGPKELWYAVKATKKGTVKWK